MKRLLPHTIFISLVFYGNVAYSKAEQIVHNDINDIIAIRHDNNMDGIADTSNTRSLDEVVVVAQPKENLFLRQQPISSSVFTNEETSRLHIDDIRQLSSFVPSFNMPEYGSRLTSAIYIRGIGSRINNPAVGVYLDGMPLLNKSGFNFHASRIARVDVLRGPQGTLYGLNTEGGLVRMYSRNPLAESGTEVSLSAGNHFYRNAEIAHTLRLSEKTALSVSAFYDGQNGFMRNATTSNRSDRYDEAGGRVKVAFSPDNRWQTELTADYQYTDQNGFAYGRLDPTSGKAESPAANRQGEYRRNMLNTAFNARYTVSGLSLSSTTSYQFLYDNMYMDQDYTAADYMHLKQKQLSNGITQELTAKVSKSAIWNHSSGIFTSYQWLRTDAPVYFDNEFTSAMARNIQGGIKSAIINAMASGMMNRPGITADQATQMAAETIEKRGGVSVGDVNMLVPGMFHTPQYNLGIYHESDIRLADKLNLTIGLRYDLSHLAIRYNTAATMSMTVNVMGTIAGRTISSALNRSEHKTHNELLPKVAIRWGIDNNGSNVYLLTSKGYRTGGYNIQIFSDILQTEIRKNSMLAMKGDVNVNHSDDDYAAIKSTIEYKPEESWNFEAGTHLNLFGDRVKADFAAYYILIKDQQLSVMAGDYGFGRMMVNAGRSHSCGLEANVRGATFDNKLSWSAAYGFTRTVFDRYEETAGGVKTDYEGRYVPFVPRHTLGGTIDYTIIMGNGKEKRSMTFGLNCTAQGKTYWDNANTFSQEMYALLGAHADLRIKTFTISVWAKNITDTRYNTFAFSSSATGSEQYFAQRGTPFQIGTEIKIRF